MACLGTLFLRLLPTWVRWPFATPSNSDLPSRSSSRNTSSQEGSSSVYPRTSYVSGILELPCPPLAHLPTPSKSAVHRVDGYQRWKPFSFNPTPPIPRERIKSPALRKSPILFKYNLGVERFLKYQGVGYKPSSPYCLWLSVQYHDLSTGLVGVSSFFFNADVSLQQKLKDLVPRDDWQYLEQKYGFGFLNQIL